MKNLKSTSLLFLALTCMRLSIMAQDTEDVKKTIKVPPTDKSATLQRGGPGAYLHNRGSGKLHQGIDIVANQSSMNKELYKVMAVNNGRIAYAKLNPSATEGYGYTIIIDHGTGYYTLYGHLAYNASKDLHKVGDEVQAGEVIAYIADLSNNEKSSGNVLAEVVKPYDKIQLHLEVFKSTAGRTSATVQGFKDNNATSDPTPGITQHGYKSF